MRSSVSGTSSTPLTSCWAAWPPTPPRCCAASTSRRSRRTSTPATSSIIINAGKVALTGNKRQTKVAYRHSGYPGGLKQVGYDELLTKRPERAIELAVKGMLPHNRLGRQLIKKLKVYAGAEHPHAAQQPVPFEIKQIAQ